MFLHIKVFDTLALATAVSLGMASVSVPLLAQSTSASRTDEVRLVDIGAIPTVRQWTPGDYVIMITNNSVVTLDNLINMDRVSEDEARALRDGGDNWEEILRRNNCAILSRDNIIVRVDGANDDPDNDGRADRFCTPGQIDFIFKNERLAHTNVWAIQQTQAIQAEVQPPPAPTPAPRPTLPPPAPRVQPAPTPAPQPEPSPVPALW